MPKTRSIRRIRPELLNVGKFPQALWDLPIQRDETVIIVGLSTAYALPMDPLSDVLSILRPSDYAFRGLAGT